MTVTKKFTATIRANGYTSVVSIPKILMNKDYYTNGDTVEVTITKP